MQPSQHPSFERYVDILLKLRQRKGLNRHEARARVYRRNMFCSLMLENGEIDGMLTGLNTSYNDAIRAPLQVIRTRNGRRAGGVYILVFKNDLKFLADCTVNLDPSAEELAEIAVHTADLARSFDVEPRVAMLSYSNFGTASGTSPDKVRRATEIAKRLRPDLMLDGEMQADAALLQELRKDSFPFTTLTEDANVLIFPDLDAANIAYKLLWLLGGAEVIGPVLLNMNKPVNVLQMGSQVHEIVQLAAVTALRAQGEAFAY